MHLRRGLTVRGLVLLHPLDLAIAFLVLLFFVVNAWLRGGDILLATQGAVLIMLVMFAVGMAIEVVIEALRNLRGLGTAVGFITNGPEALCMLVGLLTRDIIYAASTPLGSNIMNPIMLFSAAVIVGVPGAVMRQDRILTLATLLVTAFLASIFFVLPPSLYWLWLGVTAAASILLFLLRSKEPESPACCSPAGLRPWHALPATLLLIGAGFCLDPVVTMTAEASRAHKGVIGFFVLAALTSWPEFRSCMTLLRRGRTISAVLNITVSNLTNLWLALIGLLVFQIIH
jgi:cation:H+ antiporter